MTLLDVQRRFVEIARLRTGEKVAAGNGKSRPKKLETWRITSPNKEFVKAAAAKYGGSVAAWNDQWEVITESDSLDVMLPPSTGVRQYSLFYELWSGGGCQRRCDGAQAMVAHGDKLVESACLCDADNRECKPTLRVGFFLPDLPGLGIARLDTGGFNAAAELPGMLDLLAQFTAAGKPVRAILRLEQRTSKKGGQTRKFAVPVIDLPYSLAELTGGELGQLPTNGQATPQLTSSPRPVEGEEPAVPEKPATAPQPAAVAADEENRPDRPPRPPRSVMPLDKPLEGDELQRWRAGTHAAMRARIAEAADEHEALRQVASKVVDLGERSLNELTLREWQTVATTLREIPLTEPPGQERPESPPGATAPAPVGIDTDAAPAGTRAASTSVVVAPADGVPASQEADPVPPGEPAAPATLTFDEILDSVWETAADAGRVDRDSQDWGPLYALAREVYPGRDPDGLDETDWLAIRAILAGETPEPIGRPRGGA